MPFEPPASREEAAPQPNIIQTFSDALRDTETIREKLRGIMNANDRHGDLQVALSALKRLETGIRTLIAAEEV
jgi:hypothetical protein